MEDWNEKAQLNNAGVKDIREIPTNEKGEAPQQRHTKQLSQTSQAKKILALDTYKGPHKYTCFKLSPKSKHMSTSWKYPLKLIQKQPIVHNHWRDGLPL